MTPKTDVVRATAEQDTEWLQVTPGERLKIRVRSAQTVGAYSVLEIVADPGNGVPLLIHDREEEHFIALEGTLDIADGDGRWDAPAGTSVTVRRGAACVVQFIGHAFAHVGGFYAGLIEGLFSATVGVEDVDKITAIAARFGTRLVGPLLRGTARSIYSPQDDQWPRADQPRFTRTRMWRCRPLARASDGNCVFGEKNDRGEIAMEIHSRRSLYEIHGIIAPPQRRSRWGTIARRAVTCLLALLKRAKVVIEAELAARRDIGQLAGMNDYMLRDIGITRSEIEGSVRRPWTNIATDDEPVRSNDTRQNYSALPTVYSPDLVSEGRPERQLREIALMIEERVTAVDVPTHTAASGIGEA
jgi:uncharacterized protein YjiS (DUF1127 family)/mannose-6-phosphate isomerase-like protein (cupin superfamily)